jgi:hypothetical protein
MAKGYATRTHYASEEKTLLYRLGSSEVRVIRVRGMCGIWMYPEGQFVEEGATCAHCQAAMKRRTDQEAE